MMSSLKPDLSAVLSGGEAEPGSRDHHRAASAGGERPLDEIEGEGKVGACSPV